MRRLFATVVFAALALAPTAFAAPVFFVEGRGWGHGIGMAQYGAQGYATRGRALPLLDPRPLLPGHHARAHDRRVGARPPDGGPKRAHGRLRRGLLGHGRGRAEVRAAARLGQPRDGARDHGEGRAQATCEPRPLRARRQGARARRPRLPGRAGRALRGRLALRRQRRRPRGVPLRRRPGRDASELAHGGAEGPGGRGTLVRRRLAPDERELRPLLRHAEPGLRRHRIRGDANERRGRRDGRRGGHASRPSRLHLLPLHLGRTDGRDPGRLERRARPVPRGGRRPARRPLALPPLGPLPLHRRRPRVAPRLARPRRVARGRRRSSETARAGPARCRRAARAGTTRMAGTTFQSRLGLRSSRVQRQRPLPRRRRPRGVRAGGAASRGRARAQGGLPRTASRPAAPGAGSARSSARPTDRSACA